MSSTPVAAVLERLEGVKRNGQGYAAKCPAHEDRRQSLTVAEGEDGRVLLHCHAGCELEAILEALRLDTKDLFPDAPKGKAKILATYDYTDEAGKLLYQVCRKAPKDFKQRRPNGRGGWIWKLEDTRRVLYRLPKVIEEAGRGGIVYVVEGEKDVEALESIGAVATCNPCGAGKWQPEYADYLRGAQVIVVADKDEPGRKHAAEVAASLKDKAASLAVVEAKEGKDAADHLAAGYGPDEFKLVDLPEADEPVRLKVYTTQELLDYQAEEVDFIIESITGPSLLSLMAGGAKSGKTTGIVGAVSAMERKVPWAGLATRPAKVLYVSEQTEPTFTTLLRYYGIKSCLYTVFPHRFPELTWLQIVAQAEEIAAAEGCELIVYDTVNDLAGVENENDSMEVRRALLPLRHQAARGYAVLAIAHAGKVEDPDIAAAPRGSSAWAAGPDIILHWVREKNQDIDGPRILGSIGRLACIDRLYVLRDGIDYIASGTVREVKVRKRQDELLAYLAEEGEPRDRRQIREHFDVSSDNTIREWIGPLLERGEVREVRGKGGKITYQMALGTYDG